MKTKITAGAIALIAVMGIVSADPWNKKTTLDVKETILIPGKELPPGKYVMKLVDSQANRHIVQIMNEREDKVEATILAIPNYRMQPTGKTELRYWESQAGTPPALRAWFFPGDNFGQEFAYPKDVADRLSAANKTNVAWYDAGQDAAGLKTAELHDADRGVEQAQAAPAPVETVTPQPEPQPVQQVRTEPQPQPAPVAAAPEPAPAPQPEPQVIAQNRTPVEEPAAAPAPQPAPAELPQTAGSLWAVGLAGCVLLAAGMTLVGVRRVS
jgi:hypothetical protein